MFQLWFVKVWKPNLRCISIAGPSKGVLDCFFSNDESKLLVCGIDGSVQFWCLEKEQPLAAFGVDSECLTCVDKADIDDFLAQGTADKGVLLWKLDFADAVMGDLLLLTIVFDVLNDHRALRGQRETRLAKRKILRHGLAASRKPVNIWQSAMTTDQLT